MTDVIKNKEMILNLDVDLFGQDIKWKQYHRKQYYVQIQKAKSDRIYNVKDKVGVVYNFLEDVEALIDGYDYIVTGVAGEMWPIHKAALCGYEIDNIDSIGIEPKQYKSKARDITYMAVCIPVKHKFQIQLESGTILNGNTEGVEHATGDYILYTSLDKKDFRIINGNIFDQMYELIY